MTVELSDPPTDGISSLNFSPFNYSSFLLATSWDSSIYLYDCDKNRSIGKCSAGAAVLDGCFSETDQNVAYAVGLNRQIHRLDSFTGQLTNFGQHDDAIKSICHSKSSGLIFSGSWDRSVGVWDEFSRNCVARLNLPDKVYSMDICNDKNLLLVATAGRHIYLYDTRSLSHPLQKRESSLKYQTRSVKFFPSGDGFVCASIEGRVAVDFVDPSAEVQQSRYAFKCHRQSTSSDPATGSPMEIVYPVNAVAYHPKLSCFFTGGSDGVVNSWDRINRKRIRQFSKFPVGISSLAIDPVGKYLAIGASYSYEEGEKSHPPESIFIHKLDDSDVRSKSASSSNTV